MATEYRTATRNAQHKSAKRQKQRTRKLSRTQKPDDMTLEVWQMELRRQFGRDQSYRLKNIGDQPIFSEFEVSNPQSNNTYCVTIRGSKLGDNACTCPDFTTNTLGTCKHIEYTLSRLEKKRGGKRALREGFHPPYSEIVLRNGAQREVIFRPGTDMPAPVARLVGDFFDDDCVLLPSGFAKFERFLSQAAEQDHELRCADDVLEFVAERRDAERRQQVIARAFPRGVRNADLKKLLKTPLYEYQAEGALFAAQAGRCLIGDAMGLGKTIQAIAAAEIMARHFGVERVLVVCPTSLKHQWEREIERFTDRSVQVIGGLRGQRHGLFRSPDAFFKLTNYDTVHTDLDAIEDWSPDLVILDEAQRIKNWSTRVARSVKKITSPYAIVLTGTPLENRLEELVSIVQFVDRYRLGPTFRLLHDHQVRDENSKVVGYRDLDRIGATLKPILIRRQKEEVLKQLPERLDKHFFVEMTPQQWEFHQDNRDIVRRIVQKWQRYKFLSEADQRRLMIALQCMRMSCDSTYLLDHQTDHGVKADELATLLEEVFESPDAKVVVFSQWLRMHEVVTRRLDDRGWSYVLFHGGVPGDKRKQLVDRFRTDPDCRLFLATDAGGVGLNLQHASMVVNLDLPWNPAVLEQRIGRVHRLGQQRPVQVVNFVSQGTIEEGMLSVLKFKKSLFAGVLDGGENEVFLGGSRLNNFMDTGEQPTASISETPPVQEEKPDTSSRRQTRQKRDERQREAQRASSPDQTQALSGLLEAGVGFLQQLKAAIDSSKAGTESKSSLVARDDQTGQHYLKLPMPTPELLDKAMKAVSAFL